MSKEIIVLGNSAGWCGKSWEDIKKRPGCKIVNEHLPGKYPFLDSIIRFHYSEKVNRIVTLPFKEIWFNYFYRNLIGNATDSVLIIYDGNKLGNNERFLSFLKRKCSKLRLIYIITNEVQYCIATRNNFYDKLKNYYDVIYGFHIPDKEKYGIDIMPLVYSKNEISHGQAEKRFFFAGEAKTRLTRIIDICRKGGELGFNSLVVALHVDEDKQVKSRKGEKILYNHPISYDEVIKNTQESAVIIEVPQDGLEAITIKTCEAIFYNKLLITMNPLIKEMPFYDSRYMLYIESPDDINGDFLNNWDKVHYSKTAIDYFSVDTILKRILNDLDK